VGLRNGSRLKMGSPVTNYFAPALYVIGVEPMHVAGSDNKPLEPG